MELYQMTMSKDDAWFVMNAIGLQGQVHFIDLNKGEQAFHLPYTNQLRRCDESLRRIDLIVAECKKLKIKVPKVGSVEHFQAALQKVLQERKKAENVLLDEVELDVTQKERFLTEQIQTLQEMNDNLNALIEHKAVISIASQIINGV
jgi:V-type H+-transporting ATPase subunit a